MKFKLITTFSLIFAVSSAFADYRVGIETRNISPTNNEALASCMGGYGSPFSRCSNTAIHDPITLRSLYLSDEDTETLLISIDTVGVGDALIERIKHITSRWTRLSPDQVHVSATHTHSGPDLQGLWGGVSPEYKNRIIFNAVYASLLAKYQSRKSDIFALTSYADVINRRGLQDVDTTVNSLLFRNTHTGKPTAMLVNMSAHPTILDDTNNEYSADYVHYLRKKLEAKLGVDVIFINGILGDAEPFDPQNPSADRSFTTAKEFGTKVATNILNNIASAEQITGDLTVESTTYSHPVTNMGMLALASAGLLDVSLNELNEVSAPIFNLSIGDSVNAVSLPGEALTSLGRSIQSEMHGRYNLVFGLTDASYGYFIPSTEFGSIPGRITEEAASIDAFAGDSLESKVLEFLVD